MSQVCFDRTSLCNVEQTSDRDVYVLLFFFSCILRALLSFFSFLTLLIHAYTHERNGTVCKIGNRIKSRKTHRFICPPDIIFSFLIFFQPVHLSTRNPDLSPSHSHESVALSYAVVVFVLTAEIEQSIQFNAMTIYLYIRGSRFFFNLEHSDSKRNL